MTAEELKAAAEKEAAEKLESERLAAEKIKFDAEAAKIRRATEENLLKQLGLKDKSEIEAFKKQKEEALTSEQRIAAQLEDMQAEFNKMKLSEKKNNQMIEAMALAPNQPKETIEMIVKMANGLISDELDFTTALTNVVGMVTTPAAPTIVGVPPLLQPDKPTPTIANPWKKENFNLTEQGKIFRADPEKARKLASEAGAKLNY